MGRRFIKVNSSRCALLVFDIDSDYWYADYSASWLETFGHKIGSLSGYKRELLCKLSAGKISKTVIHGPFVGLPSDYILDCRCFAYKATRRMLVLIQTVYLACGRRGDAM